MQHAEKNFSITSAFFRSDNTLKNYLTKKKKRQFRLFFGSTLFLLVIISIVVAEPVQIGQFAHPEFSSRIDSTER
jgi:hypothetical protein